MGRKDPLIKMAIKIQKHLDRSGGATRLYEVADCARHNARYLKRYLALSQYARQRGWMAAAHHVDRQLASALQNLHTDSHFDPSTMPPTQCKPTLGDLWAELHQLQNEFEECKFDLKAKTVSARTDFIVLKEVRLGRFRIRLYLERLKNRLDTDAFDIVALDPNPSSGERNVNHPHVSDEKLCAGDAAELVHGALVQGRICDAFLAISAVLHTYNPHSAYAQLADWQGNTCPDCGSSIGSDGGFYCENCGREYCDGCFTSCDACGESACHSCLELKTDKETGEMLCHSCRHQCKGCRRIVSKNTYDQATGLCPGCLNKQQENQDELTNQDLADQGEPAVALVAAAPDPAQGADVCPVGMAET